MQRTTVSSSNIASIGYDAENRILEVEFLNSSVYQYFNIPQSLYQGLMSASSHGSYFDAYIKKGGFTYQKIA
ncbi:MAG TPA: KTSC domain-containing protein [Nostocaceae cyanobacterium]|nr:KTSC domain-containing protein [Nostocaceae cyanobacterium]